MKYQNADFEISIVNMNGKKKYQFSNVGITEISSPEGVKFLQEQIKRLQQKAAYNINGEIHFNQYTGHYELKFYVTVDSPSDIGSLVIAHERIKLDYLAFLERYFKPEQNGEEGV